MASHLVSKTNQLVKFDRQSRTTRRRMSLHNPSRVSYPPPPLAHSWPSTTDFTPETSPQPSVSKTPQPSPPSSQPQLQTKTSATASHSTKTSESHALSASAILHNIKSRIGLSPTWSKFESEMNYGIRLRSPGGEIYIRLQNRR